MLKKITAALWAATALCKTLEHCPSGARYLIALFAIVAIAYVAQAALARVYV